MATPPQTLGTTSKPARTRAPWLTSRRVNDVIAYAIIIFMVLFCLLPFVWPLVSAFSIKPENVSGAYLYWPKQLTLEHFNKAIFGRGEALTLLKNSMIVTVSAIAIAVIVSTMGGYALSRMDFRWKRGLMYSILLVQIIPSTATILPFYIIIRELHLVDSLLGVILGLTAGQIPFILWVMKGFFDDVPRQLEEAAVLDGATRFQVLVRIVMPLTLPGITAATVLSFNGAWSAFFLPLIVLSSADKFVLPLGLFRAIVGYTNIDYGMMNAMAMIYMGPSLILFIAARKYLVRGVMAGAMAGN